MKSVPGVVICRTSEELILATLDYFGWHLYSAPAYAVFRPKTGQRYKRGWILAGLDRVWVPSLREVARRLTLLARRDDRGAQIKWRPAKGQPN